MNYEIEHADIRKFLRVRDKECARAINYEFRELRDGTFAVDVTKLNEPTVLPEGKFFYEDYEIGEGHSNTGWAVVVAGKNGERLVPIYEPRKKYCHQPHAVFRFYNGAEYTRIHALTRRNDDKVQILRISIRSGEIQREELYQGSPEDMHQDLEKYKTAVNAALDKASCYHCRDVHYVHELLDKRLYNATIRERPNGDVELAFEDAPAYECDTTQVYFLEDGTALRGARITVKRGQRLVFWSVFGRYENVCINKITVGANGPGKAAAETQRIFSQENAECNAAVAALPEPLIEKIRPLISRHTLPAAEGVCK